MVAAPPSLARLAAELEQVLDAATVPVARVLIAHERFTLHLRHPGVGELVASLAEVTEVLQRFDLGSLDSAGAVDAIAPPAAERFDAAFDDALARMHSLRREAARAGLAAASRGHELGPQVVQLRRELQALNGHAERAVALVGQFGDPGQTIPSGRVWTTVTTLAQHARELNELHAAGRTVLEALRDGEEAFAALLVRLKHEMAPTYVEWKRLLAPVAMRAFAAEPQALDLPEAREAHALLQRQVQVACEAALVFEAAQRRLEETARDLGERARSLMESLGARPRDR